jgi:transposase InsO family protein
LTTHYVLFVIDLATRRIRIAGITVHPNAEWMMQAGRNLLDAVDGTLVGKKYLILDRDTKYCAAFRQMLAREGIAVIRLAPRSPNLNAYAERWIRSVRGECLSKVIPIGQGIVVRKYSIRRIACLSYGSAHRSCGRRPPGIKILAGLLPKSVMHRCARSCTSQRT